MLFLTPVNSLTRQRVNSPALVIIIIHTTVILNILIYIMLPLTPMARVNNELRSPRITSNFSR